MTYLLWEWWSFCCMYVLCEWFCHSSRWFLLWHPYNFNWNFSILNENKYWSLYIFGDLKTELFRMAMKLVSVSNGIFTNIFGRTNDNQKIAGSFSISILPFHYIVGFKNSFPLELKQTFNGILLATFIEFSSIQWACLYLKCAVKITRARIFLLTWKKFHLILWILSMFAVINEFQSSNISFFSRPIRYYNDRKIFSYKKSIDSRTSIHSVCWICSKSTWNFY